MRLRQSIQHGKITTMAVNVRSEMKKTMQEIINFGGGLSCNDVKAEETGRRYYDFVSHFIEVRCQDQAFKECKWKMRTRLLFGTRCIGSETAQALREMIDKKLLT